MRSLPLLRGWFYLGARTSELAVLAGGEGLAGTEALTGDALMTALGIGAHRLVGVSELVRDPWVIAHGLRVTRRHDTGEVIITGGPSVRLSATPVAVGRAAASPGADGRGHVLARAGTDRVALRRRVARRALWHTSAGFHERRG